MISKGNLFLNGLKEAEWADVKMGDLVWIENRGHLKGPFTVHNHTLHWLERENSSIFQYYGPIYVKEA